MLNLGFLCLPGKCLGRNTVLTWMLSVPEMAAALGISRAGAYELVRTEGFPALKIGSRIVIPKDKLREWVDQNTGNKGI